MARHFVFALALSCWAFTATEAFALGSDHPKGPVEGNELWPDGLKDLANRPDRVHGFWVNETDVFFYDGDSKAFNQFLEGYSKLKNSALQIVIHPGVKKARSPWDKADREVPVAWSLHASSSPLDGVVVPEAGGQFYTLVDVWLGSSLKLEELRIPAGLEVVSGGEIEKFIAVQAWPALACHPTRAAAGEPGKVLTAEQILRDQVTGAVRVELAVEGWVKLRGAFAGPEEHQHLALKGATLGAERLHVLVGPKVFARLRTLGIADPREHFVGQAVVVAGMVYRNPAPMGGTSITLQVDDLAQVESIAKK